MDRVFPVRSIVLSQGCTGTGSLSSLLNKICAVYSAHGHFPLDKDNPINYEGSDYSDTLGHSMKGIYDGSLESVFLLLEDCFPARNAYILTHTFTLSSLESKHGISNALREGYRLVNIIRDPFDVVDSSSRLAVKTLEKTRYGRMELINSFNRAWSDCKIRRILNAVGYTCSGLEAVDIAEIHAILAGVTMIRDAFRFRQLVETLRIEDVTSSVDSFMSFCERIAGHEPCDSSESFDTITDLIFRRTNSHQCASPYTMSEKSKEAFFHLLTEEELLFTQAFYPSGQYSFRGIDNGFWTIGGYGSALSVSSRKEELRACRDDLVSLFANVDKCDELDISIRRLRLTHLLQEIDMCLQREDSINEQPSVDCYEISLSKVRIIQADDESRYNLVRLNNAAVAIVPWSLGPIDFSEYKNIYDLLNAFPSIEVRMSIGSVDSHDE